MTRTQIFNAIYWLVCLLAALGAESGILAFLPEKWRHVVTGVAVFAAFLKSHWNFNTNPDGTPAQAPYEPKR